MRIAVRVALLVPLIYLATIPQAGSSRAPVHSVVIAETDWPPYFFAGKPNTPEGFGKELLKNCMLEMGYSCDFKFYPVNR